MKTKKPKIKIIEIPELITNQAHHILNNKAYSSAYRKEVIRQLLGKCQTCDGIPNRFVIEKQDGAEIIMRYCSLH